MAAAVPLWQICEQSCNPFTAVVIHTWTSESFHSVHAQNYLLLISHVPVPRVYSTGLLVEKLFNVPHFLKKEGEQGRGGSTLKKIASCHVEVRGSIPAFGLLFWVFSVGKYYKCDSHVQTCMCRSFSHVSILPPHSASWGDETLAGQYCGKKDPVMKGRIVHVVGFAIACLLFPNGKYNIPVQD